MGLEGWCWGPREKNPLEGLPEPQGLSTCRETDTRTGHSEHGPSDLSPAPGLSRLHGALPGFSGSGAAPLRPLALELAPSSSANTGGPPRPAGKDLTQDGPPAGPSAPPRALLTSALPSRRGFLGWTRTGKAARWFEMRHPALYPISVSWKLLLQTPRLSFPRSDSPGTMLSWPCSKKET